MPRVLSLALGWLLAGYAVLGALRHQRRRGAHRITIALDGRKVARAVRHA